MIMPTAKRNSSSGTKNASTDITELIKIRSALAWRPSEGDILEGKVKKLLGRASDFGVYPVVVIDNGEANYTAVHAFHTILRDALKELKTKPDDDIVIVYQGKIRSNKPYGYDAETQEPLYRSYHSYVVIGNGVDSTVEFTWDDEWAPDGDEPDFK